jgi:hypothetical protein
MAAYRHQLMLERQLQQQQAAQAGQQISDGLAIIAQSRAQREAAQREAQEQQQSPQAVRQEQDEFMRKLRWHGSRKGAVHLRGANDYAKVPSGTIVVWPDGDCWKKP